MSKIVEIINSHRITKKRKKCQLQMVWELGIFPLSIKMTAAAPMYYSDNFNNISQSNQTILKIICPCNFWLISLLTYYIVENLKSILYFIKDCQASVYYKF